MLVRQNEEISAGRVSPGYKKIRQWVLDYVIENGLEAGDRLPSDRTISQLLGVNRGLVAKAVSELAEEGLLNREKGNGTFLADEVPQPKPSKTGLIGLMLPLVEPSDVGGAVGGMIDGEPDESFARTDISFDIARGARSFLSELGYRIIVHSNSRGEEQSAVLNSLGNQSPDGVIAMPMGGEASAVRFQELSEAGLKFVFVDRYFPQVPIDRVVTDNCGGAIEAVRHLVSQGHRRIAYFTSFQDISSTRDREEGYRRALDELGIGFDQDLVCGPTLARDRRWSFTYALEHCLRLPEPVTAILGLNDATVWGAVQAVGELGLSVGQDIEIAGFFDTPIPKSIPLAIGRIVQDKIRMGEIAARMLVERIERRYTGEPRHVVLPPEFLPADPPEGEMPVQILRYHRASN